MSLQQSLIPLFCLSFLLGCPAKPTPKSPQTTPTSVIPEQMLKIETTPTLSLSNPKAKEIDRLEDSRNVKSELWSPLVEDKEAKVRARAILAIGRLREPTLTPLIQKALSDKEPIVRRMAAFSVGLLRDNASEELVNELHAALLREVEKIVRQEILLALGRAGKENSWESLVGALADQETQEKAALAIGLYAQRGKSVPKEAFQALDPLLRANDSAIRFAAVYAMMRGKVVRPYLLTIIAKEENPETRATGARALGEAFAQEEFTSSEIEQILVTLASDPDWRVQVEAIRALSKGSAKSSTTIASLIGDVFFTLSSQTDSLSGPKIHPILAGLDTLSTLALDGKIPPYETIEGIYRTSMSLQEAPKSAHLGLDAIHCQAAFLLDIRQKTPDKTKTCGPNNTNEWRREVLSAQLWTYAAKDNAKAASKGLQKLLTSKHPRVRVEALNALAEIPGNLSTKAIRNMLQDPDLAVSTTAVEAIGKRAKAEKPEIDKNALKPTLALLDRYPSPAEAESIIAVYNTLAVIGSANDKEVKLAISRGLQDQNAAIKDAAKQAYETLGIVESAGETPIPKPLPASKEEGPAPGDSVPIPKPNTKVEIKTTKGSFSFMLLVDAAPRTCANFVSLAKKGYFENILFHRVVPGFVIQGGDPLGTGWGGPGYAIRDELSPEPYQEGTVGMALAGPDTGGSQWFVMHQWHPHLDSRYPVFGRLLSGKNIVDSIQVGDTILEVRIISP